jgi:predicted nicotinamide N-methyase
MGAALQSDDNRDGEQLSAMRAELSTTYPIRTESVTLGPLVLTFHRCADPDAVLDQVAEEADRREKSSGVRDLPGDTLHLPYWAELWDSSYVIGEMLARRDLRGVAVLDLGCGMGMTAAAAAFAGANVVAADLEPPALRFAELNTFPWRDRVTTRRTDWTIDDLGQRFPLIVGTDILYERKQWPFLHRFFLRHLATGGEVLLGEPGRQTGEAFLPFAGEHGWRVETSQHPTPTPPVPIRVMSLRRSD